MPFVVKLIFVPYRRQILITLSKSSVKSSSPMVEGMISLGGASASSCRIRSMVSMAMRRLGRPAALRFVCVLLYGEWSSHIMQVKLQSSGLVSNVMRQGQDTACQPARTLIRVADRCEPARQHGHQLKEHHHCWPPGSHADPIALPSWGSQPTPPSSPRASVDRDDRTIARFHRHESTQPCRQQQQ